jgi:putative acetyltransferase
MISAQTGRGNALMSPFSATGQINALTTSVSSAEITIENFDAGQDADAFRSLNEEWIACHFALERKDIEMLGNPQKSILEKGGAIFMLYAQGQPAGCAALLAMGGDVYELSKMAIAPHLRGQGLGRRLLLHTIEAARELGARSLFLGSSTKLANAVHLYESVGFRHVKRETLPPMPYLRADIFMALTF